MPLKSPASAVDFSRRISIGLLASVALLSMTVAAIVLWMAVRQNEVAAETTTRMVVGGMASQKEGLAVVTRDNALWTSAYEALNAGDAEWLYNNVGLSAEDGTLDLVLMVQAGDAARFSWDSETGEEPTVGLIEAEAVDAVFDLLDALPVGSRQPVTTYARSGDQLWMLSAARVVPWEGLADGTLDAEVPRQIFGRRLDDAVLADIGAQYLVDDLSLAPAPVDGKGALMLAGADGAPVAYAVWTQPRPGRSALMAIIGPLALVAATAGTGVVLASRYILDSARRLQRALVAAQAADRSKSEFIAGLSHELRTPLNGVIGLAQVLLMGDTLTDEDREMVNVIHRSGMTQLGLIEELLDVSSIEAGRRVLDTSPFDPVEALCEVATLALPAAAEKGIALETQLPAGPPARVLGDRHAFMQICTNLIGNAVKFTGEGSVAVTLSITSHSGEAGLRLRVADTGPGIDPSAHAAIFDRFYQIDGGLTRNAGGAGLGLAITRSLVELMDGTIRIDSASGEGAVFTVDLKLEIAEAEALAQVA